MGLLYYGIHQKESHQWRVANNGYVWLQPAIAIQLGWKKNHVNCGLNGQGQLAFSSFLLMSWSHAVFNVHARIGSPSQSITEVSSAASAASCTRTRNPQPLTLFDPVSGSTSPPPCSGAPLPCLSCHALDSPLVLSASSDPALSK